MSKLDSDRAYEALISSGEDWADKDAAANLLEETRKSVLAKLKNESEAKSDAARESEALTKQEYHVHVEAMIEARRQANRARVKYDSAKVLAEMRRSEESTRRAEMTLR
jgi:hypothetical protein